MITPSEKAKAMFAHPAPNERRLRELWQKFGLSQGIYPENARSELEILIVGAEMRRLLSRRAALATPSACTPRRGPRR